MNIPPSNKNWTGSEKSKGKWFDEYHELVTKPTKVGEVAVYVQASRLKTVAADLPRSFHSPSTGNPSCCWKIKPNIDMKNSVCVKSGVAILFSGMPFASLSAQSESASMPAKVIGEVSDGRIQPPRAEAPTKQPDFQIHWSKVQYKNGQKFTLNRVAPPLPSKQDIPVRNPRTETAETPSAAELQQAADKSGGTFMVYATIYDHRITSVRWQCNGEKYHAYSNIDFNHLNGFHSFEGRGKNYTMMLLTGNASRKDIGKNRKQTARKKMAAGIARLPRLAKRGPSYVVVQGDESNDGAMEFIEALHDLYAAEQPRLIAAYRARIRNGKIRAQHDAELLRNPPPKPDVTINFWKRDVQKERADAAALKTQKGGK